MEEKNSFNYESEMKEYYKSDEIAEEYDLAFSDDGSWRHWVIANRERTTVRLLLRRVPHDTVLDIPAGTGKLAPVFAELGASVLACDISEYMLRIARTEYDQAGIGDVHFRICDAERVSKVIDRTFDVAVCLRFLHRVPQGQKRRILHELGNVADYVIASTAVESQFHKARRWIRKKILGGDNRGHCYEALADTEEILSDGFDIMASKHVLPLISQERIYLLRPDA